MMKEFRGKMVQNIEQPLTDLSKKMMLMVRLTGVLSDRPKSVRTTGLDVKSSYAPRIVVN